MQRSRSLELFWWITMIKSHMRLSGLLGFVEKSQSMSCLATLHTLEKAHQSLGVYLIKAVRAIKVLLLSHLLITAHALNMIFLVIRVLILRV